MTNWYDMPGALDFSMNPDYLEKFENDCNEEASKSLRRVMPQDKRKDSPKVVKCAWTQKRAYKKKLARRFLSINPDLHYSEVQGTQCCNSDCFFASYFEDGSFYDIRMIYSFNQYTKVYLSLRGDLRKYQGDVYRSGRGCYTMTRKDKGNTRIRNRRIRHHALDDEAGNDYSYFNKLYSPITSAFYRG